MLPAGSGCRYTRGMSTQQRTAKNNRFLGPAVSGDEARRIALAAQQFGSGNRGALRTARSVADLVRQLGVVQIDSVNVLVRSHYLPLFSRRRDYDRQLLERAAYGERTRALFEYWGHEASLLPIEYWPLFQWRMEQARRGEGTWGRLRRYATEHQDLVAAVRSELHERGALGAGELIRAESAGAERAGTKQTRGGLVGLESEQGDSGMAVLDRRSHDRESPQFRASVRSDGTGDSRVDSVPADTDQGRRAASAHDHCRTRARCSHST